MSTVFPARRPGVGVMLYLIQPSGRIRTPFHTPSLAQSRPKRAQSRAVAYMKDEPTKVPDGSGSITALVMPMRSNSALRGKERGSSPMLSKTWRMIRETMFVVPLEYCHRVSGAT